MSIIEKECRNCEYFVNEFLMQKGMPPEKNDEEGFCFRYPEMLRVEVGHWCGEFKCKEAYSSYFLKKMMASEDTPEEVRDVLKKYYDADYNADVNQKISPLRDYCLI